MILRCDDTFRSGRFQKLLAILLLGPWAPGCDAAPDSIPTYTVRDSSGIQIIESSAPAWSPGNAWTVRDTATLQIGVVDGAPEYQFSLISALWRFDDGVIMAGERSSAQVRAFDSQGNALGSFGRQGDGPGEFRLVLGAAPFHGDSILVWGSGNRLATFDRSGILGRAWTLTFPPPEHVGTGALSITVPGGLMNVFSDGTLLVSGSFGVRANPGEVVPIGTSFQRYSPEGTLLTDLFAFSGATTRMPNPGGGPMPPLPYPRQFVHAIHGTRLYTGGSAGFELEYRSDDGSVERVIRALHRDLTMDDGARQAYRETVLRSPQGQAAPAEMEAALQGVEFPATIPPYTQALVDSEDHLWVRHYNVSGNSLPQTWSIFAPEGYLLGTLETPARFQVRQVGSDFLLGIWTDDLDVQHIRIYPLTR